MPLQNRVTPAGEIVAVAARGLFMGNRGILHDDQRQLGRRRWALKAWLICLTEFRGRRRAVMTPRRYTELFFFDEAAAIAAGHRPCYECRRAAFRDWQEAWQRGLRLDRLPRAPEIDAVLHPARITPRSRAQIRHEAALASLPDGAFVLHRDTPHLVLQGRLLPWSWQRYGEPVSPASSQPVTVLTPEPSIRTLQAGYRPILHPSAGTLCGPVDSDITLRS